ncbi:hypothetical protein MJO28_004647 [Puccinia striiformis f. sp. tritici]|uniref:Uncharacterized protein n=1 Tax=Puccinia striiformis f. sp. tritici TaxID=168172 RepID=A0ACC0ET24_9BASI|nr:hypothetical protein MJO28_004647 [Puccinia striiformis f. sp. tritici]
MSFRNTPTPYNLIKHNSPVPSLPPLPLPNQAPTNIPAPEVTSDRTAALEQENRQLREEYDSIKRLLQTVAIEKTSTPKNGSNPSTPKAKNPLKSVTPAKLKKETPDHDLDTVPLDHVGKKLLQSCYDLARCLMRRRKATEPVPAPPTIHERDRIEGFFNVCDTPPNDSAGPRIQQREVVPIEGSPKVDNDYVQYIHATMQRWGISRFTMDWDQNWDNRFNQIMSQFFLRVWKWGLACNRFGLPAQHEASKINMDEHTLMAIYWRHCKSLRRYFKRGKKGGEKLAQDQTKNTARQSLKRKSVARQLYLQQQGVHPNFIEPFDEKSVNSDDELVVEDEVVVALAKTPFWRSHKATAFIEWIERRRRTQKVVIGKTGGFGNQAALRPRRRPTPEIVHENCRIPVGLPQDFYSEAFLQTLSFADKKLLEIGPNLFDMIDDFDFIIPACEGNFHHYPDKAHIEYAAQANDESDDEGEGEVEFLAEDGIEVKIEEDEEML